MTLVELADSYRNTAAILRVAIEDAKDEIAASRDPGERMAIELKIKDYMAARRQCRILAKLCETYYTNPRDQTFAMTVEEEHGGHIG